MQYHSRSIEDNLNLLTKELPCVLITGARQVGKTTLLRERFGSFGEFLTFDPVQDLYGEKSDPDLFLRNHPPPLILDEIQYVPQLVPALKRYVDSHRRPGLFLITGSQQWSVMRHISESLAGRLAMLNLAPFSLAEGADCPAGNWLPQWLEANALETPDALDHLIGGEVIDFIPGTSIWRGSFPEVATLSDTAISAWMQGYVSTYLQRDVRQMLDIRDESQFGVFLSLCASLTGQEVNRSQLGRDIGLSSPTAKKWLDVLKAGMQWIELPAFSRNMLKRLSHRPKGYMADTGLACHLMRLPVATAVSGHPAYGALFETLAVTDLIKQTHAMPTPPCFYHYRQHSGAEVDLVVEYGGKLYPIEIKSTARVRPTDARGIRIFQETMNPDEVGPGIVLYAGTECLRLDENILAVPLGWATKEIRSPLTGNKP